MNKPGLIKKLKEEHPNFRYFDCLSCSNSFSMEGVQLHCSIHTKIVKENELCKDFN